MEQSLKVCNGLHNFWHNFHEVYFHGVFWPLYLHSRVNPYMSFESLLHHEYNSVDCVAVGQTLKKLQRFVYECV